MIETLVSEKNPLLKEVRRAAGRGSLTEDGYAVAEGFHLLEEALASRVEIGAVIVSEGAADQAAVRIVPRTSGPRVVSVADAVFARLTTTEQPQGVITLVRPRTWTMEDVFHSDTLAVVLDGVQDPGNAGAMIRSAEAFGATGVVFLKGSVNPYNPKCLRGSAGSVFRVPIVTGVEADAVPGATIYAAMPHADRTLAEADFSKPCAIVIGGEARGVSAALAARAVAVRIPTAPVDSLNAAVACGVLLYEARRQRSR